MSWQLIDKLIKQNKQKKMKENNEKKQKNKNFSSPICFLSTSF